MTESPRLEELRRRVHADPASIAFAALAEELRRAGRFRDAVDASRAGLRHHPTYVSARVTLGRSLVELQEFDQAEREFAFVLRSAPDNLAARRALGELCWQRLRFADALVHFKAALVLAPTDVELPAVITSLERELEAERAATVRADADAAEAARAEGAVFEEPPSASAPSAGAASTGAVSAGAAALANGRASASPALAALERFYRAIVRAKTAADGADPPRTEPPHATHVSGA